MKGSNMAQSEAGRMPSRPPPGAGKVGPRIGIVAGLIMFFLESGKVFGEETNLVTIGADLPSAGVSLLRLIASLSVVLALFFGGVWVFKNWQRMAAVRGPEPRPQVLEGRHRGARQAVHAMGHEQQRFLVASSSAGVTLPTHLPEGEAQAVSTPAGQPSSPETSHRMLEPKA